MHYNKPAASYITAEKPEDVHSPTPSVLEHECPYCLSKLFVKRGLRAKKSGKVQLYLYRDCSRTFTASLIKGKHYSAKDILTAISLYNRGYTLKHTCHIFNKDSKETNKYSPASVQLKTSTLSRWLKEYEPLCRYSRLRSKVLKLYNPRNLIEVATLPHQQLYYYRYHRAKARLLIEEHPTHNKFLPLKEFLDSVTAECPHEYFKQGSRSSVPPIYFSKSQMIVRSKQNYATKLCRCILESVMFRRARHEAVKKFMVIND